MMKNSPLWEAFNDNDSFLPFYLPFAMWIAIYAYCRATGIAFYKWHTIHNLHNLGAIALGLQSLYYNNDNVFNERIPILWSISYFLIDLLDCVLRLDRDYTIHAGFCLLLGYFNYTTPTLRRLRMNSKASLCESSNPFMHLAKHTRRPAHFLLFAVVYTCCRIVWIPVMVKQLLDEGLTLTNPIQMALLGFYGLNLFWYAKIIRILVEGSRGKTASKEE
ncbi:hypothetical protein MPSEU_000200700 [Mayamaea pseudoterrestris]|nr:hypothetical protein MPSEU_000200700 [Mayamaea pseudoterrestris]